MNELNWIIKSKKNKQVSIINSIINFVAGDGCCGTNIPITCPRSSTSRPSPDTRSPPDSRPYPLATMLFLYVILVATTAATRLVRTNSSFSVGPALDKIHMEAEASHVKVGRRRGRGFGATMTTGPGRTAARSCEGALHRPWLWGVVI